MILLVPTDKTSRQPLSERVAIGEKGVLKHPIWGRDINVAADREADRELYHNLHVTKDDFALGLLAVSGRVFQVDFGTRILVIERQSGFFFGDDPQCL
ncbi:MAG: hypothetical protein ACUBOA_00285 [Candidatus Loosdrechtia sp.]|uniref:hypothetical protein n=1 Tax=Candidatus Loosdrechtia sp. TaxID=3101272 RepID=UPI003A70A4ED|nr:MAG: hypothetical protein QY305_13340 [Candidatus Jettenia sp. AMX2]